MMGNGSNQLSPPNAPASSTFDARQLTRPAPILLWYYVIVALASLPAFIITMPVLYFRFHTMRFKFDDDGVSLSWGILFRREIQLTYRRIQDIHVTRNILQRWMGLSSVAIQTASGNAGAEMTIEGVLEADELRDFLYRKMRGARGDEPKPGHELGGAAAPQGGSPDAQDEALTLLRQIRDEIRSIGSVQKTNSGASHEQSH